MAALATVEQFTALLGRPLSADEESQVGALLDGASARVRTYTGQDFTQATTTSQVKVRNRIARLPQRPVTAVASVVDLNGNAVVYTWLNDDRIQIGHRFQHDTFAFEPWHDPLGEVRVSYTHGYTDIPDDIVAVVCQVAARAFGRPADTTGLQQESIAGYSYSVGAAAAAGTVGLMLDEKAALDVYRRTISTIRTSS